MSSHTTGSIAQAVRGRVVGRADLPIEDLAGLGQAGPRSLTFIRDRGFAGEWKRSKAGGALVRDGVEIPGHDPDQRALIFVEDADLAMVEVLAMFERKPELPPVGVHPSAVIDRTAVVFPTARVGPLCAIGARTVVGEHCTIMPRVTLGADVIVGPGTTLHPGVVVYDRCSIGAQCILHSNTSIGADGFGFREDPNGRGLIKVPHIGTVKIGNGVEIGANSCVDRGKFGATTIGDGAKLDNLVQIGHNCTVGRSAVICGLSGMAGSATVGDGALIGGAVGIIDNINIGPGAKVGAKSGVMCDVPAGEIWTGLPAAPHREQMRTWSAVKRLPIFVRDVKQLIRAVKGAGIKFEESGSEPEPPRSRGLSGGH